MRGALTTSFSGGLKSSEYKENKDKKAFVIDHFIWQEFSPSIIAGKNFQTQELIGLFYFLRKEQRIKLSEDYLHMTIKGKFPALAGALFIRPLPKLIKMVQGIKMKCEGVGTPPVQVMWMKGLVMLANGTGSSEYTFQKGDTSGYYLCKATNKEGTTNMTVNVIVLGKYDCCIRVLLQRIMML